MRKGGKAYFAANLVSQASALARYIVLARLLGPEQLGLAALLILTAQFFESISDTGSDRFLVQDRDGDSPTMQGLVQLVLAVRGVAIAAALALSAGLVAGLYKAPELQMSLIALGAASLIGGLIHLDLRRVQREADFRPESLAMIVSETASLAATAIAAVITRDHTAVIYGLVVRSACLVAVSHLTAARPYRWGFGGADARHFGVFALPLAMNGLLLFFGSQGDRVIVGSGLGATALGHYSAVLLLVYYPASLIARYMTGIHLPQVAAAQSTSETLEGARARLASRSLLLSVGVLAGFALVGPFFTPLFYGQSFAQPLQIFALLGVLQGARFIRLWPTTLAVGVGRSTIVMQNNIARMAGLPVALAANHHFHTLEAVILGFIFGELLALVVALWLLGRVDAARFGRELGRVALFSAAGAVVIGLAWSLQEDAVILAAACFLAGLGVAAALAASERATLKQVATQIRARLRPAT